MLEDENRDEADEKNQGEPILLQQIKEHIFKHILLFCEKSHFQE